jgi:predicted acylesterase/phospholipase RssA
MAARSFAQHLDPLVAPKRILALDGGGLRGVLTVAILKRIEDILRDKAGGDPEFRLCDHYDLIGGTSTGSIIAAGLSLGMSVDEIGEHYFKLGQDVFKPGLLSFGILNERYDAGRVTAALKSVFGERTLGSSDFRTGLMVMSKRLDSGSPWPLTNNPSARYFNAREGSQTVANRDYPLWSVIRASTAAPTYFDPESIVIKAADPSRNQAEVRGEFVDGGVSTANNPSLQLVLTATVSGYGFGWQMGEDKLAVTSVGTGRANPALGLSTGLQSLAAAHGIKALSSVLEDCADLVETMMQWMSRSPTARELDREMGTLEGCHPGGKPCLAYHRYNVHFEQKWFRDRLGMDLGQSELDELAKMDRPSNMRRLEEIGIETAKRFVMPEHFEMA